MSKATLLGENDELIDSDAEEDQENVWITSHGKFHFSLDTLPQHLQFIHQLLKVWTVNLITLGCPSVHNNNKCTLYWTRPPLCSLVGDDSNRRT